MTQTVAETLSERLGTEVDIETIEVGLFNRLILKNVTLQDQQQKPLLQAGLITGKIELRELLKNRITLRTVSLLDTEIQLYREQKDKPTNFQFIIDALSSKEKGGDKPDVSIHSLILRRVNLSYHEYDRPRTPGLLNPGHLDFKQIDANLSLKAITTDSLNLRVRSLGFNEGCGIGVEHLQFRLTANRKQAHLQDFSLRLPHSRIALESLLFNYENGNSFKNIWHTIHTKGRLNHALVSSRDIGHLVKLPTWLQTSIILSTDFAITPTGIALNSIDLQDNEGQMQTHGSIQLLRKKGVLSSLIIRNLQLTAQPAFIQKATGWMGNNTKFTNLAKHTGTVTIKGEGQWDFKRKAHGEITLQTAHTGLADAQIRWEDKEIKTKFSLGKIRPDLLVDNSKLPTHINLDGQATLQLASQKGLTLQKADYRINLQSMQWNEHSFGKIYLQGTYSPRLLSAKLNSLDPSANGQLEVLASLGKTPINKGGIEGIRLNGNIGHIEPARLGIQTGFGQASFAGIIEAELQRLRKGIMPLGRLTVQNFQMKGAPRGDYHMQNLQASITSEGNGNEEHFKLRSDFADADIHGSLQLEPLKQTIAALLDRSLPGLVNNRFLGQTPSHIQPDITSGTCPGWDISARLKRTDFLEKMLGLPLKTPHPITLNGHLAKDEGASSITFMGEDISYNNQNFRKVSAFIHGEQDSYQCLIQGQRKLAGRMFKIAADLQTHEGKLYTNIGWTDVDGQTPAYIPIENRNQGSQGNLACVTQFFPDKEGVNFDMQIRPAHFNLGDSIWQIASGQVRFMQRELAFRNVKLSHANQQLTIDGEIAPHRNDSIVVHLQNMDIDYILDLAKFDAVSFGGQATGEAIFTQKGDYPQLNAQIQVPDFTFNQGKMGATRIIGSWNPRDNRILLDADMKLPEGKDHGTKVNGYVDLGKKELELNIQANHTNISFLQHYVDGIFGRFDGEATGSVQLYGPFKRLDFNGQLKATAEATIEATGVRYRVENGEVTLKPGEFGFHNFGIKDQNHGTGTANGYLRHTHLKNLTYNFQVDAQHLLCYDMPETNDMPFYSQTTGSGYVYLQGYPGHFTADIALTPEYPTTLTYNMANSGSLSKDDRMIRFHAIEEPADSTAALLTRLLPNHSAQETSQPSPDTHLPSQDTGTDIRLNLLIQANPSAQVKIITDPKSGDALTVSGDGAIRANFHNKGAFEMFGTYSLNRGVYKLSLQDVIRKDLALQPGSRITFTGNPLEADLDLKAIYTVNGASLSDLNYGAGFSQKSVKVDCILNIGGKAKAPQVNFDLDLHNISDDEKQMVRQLISTEEDMNRQVIYLLGIGRFYTANTSAQMGEITTSQQSSAAMRSFLSTTLTNQLNSAIASAMGGESKWSFGANVMPGTLGWDDIEVEGLLQGRLFNDRLLINGNFGYRDRPTYTSNFVGDFDIRYLLTPRGSVSLKAYSETNDRYFTKSSMTTQGIGLTLQREFSSLRDLFRVKRRKEMESKSDK